LLKSGRTVVSVGHEDPSDFVRRYLCRVERQARRRKRLGWTAIVVGVAMSIGASVRIVMWPESEPLPPPFMALFLGLVLVVVGATVVRRV
jgi:hypothetical protein